MQTTKKRPADEAGRDDRVGTESSDHHSASDYAERAAIGALLLAAPGIQSEILNAVADDDIADPRIRFVLATVRRMTAESVPVDPVTVTNFVESHGLADPSNGNGCLAVYLHDLGDAAPVPMAGCWYAASVVENAVRRRSVDRLRGLAMLFQRGDIDGLSGAAQDSYAALVADLERVGGGRHD